MKLSIITVTYNSAKEIGAYLDSIQKSPDKFTKEVIIVDNASQDETVNVIENHKFKATLIKSPSNIGFPKAVNLGIKRSQGEYILLLNPDTQLVGDCLTTLISFAESHSVGAVAPRLFYPDGTVQPSVFRLPTIFNAIKYNFFNQKTAFNKYLPEQTQPVDVAIMAALLIPRSVLDKVGLLDDRFFMYYEDIEFGRRLKRYKLPIYYLTTAKVKHVHGASGKFTSHANSPLLASAEIYYGKTYSKLLNFVLWLGHKWQVILRGHKFRD